jgi:murein DD-endopeptidase MepM/ murein hydrolase activator NlpD
LSTTRPVPQVNVRSDKAGDGKFGARRDGGRRTHEGVDILAAPGTSVVSPFDGTIDIGDAYASGDLRGKFNSLTVTDAQGHTYQYGYVSPNDSDGTPLVKRGDKVQAGQQIGTVQDRAAEDRNGKMHNHIHFEIRRGKERLDPTPQIDEWMRD